MIRPLSMRDSSLRSEWHAGLFFVILNELLGEEESLQRVVWWSGENVIDLYIWFVHSVRGVLHCIQNDMPGWLCHSERAFGRGRIPTEISVAKWWIRIRPLFMICPMNARDSSLSLRMTSQGSFLSHWPVFSISKPVYLQYAAIFFRYNFPITTSLRISQKEYKKKLVRK